MKCTECENWDVEEQHCVEGDSDPDMAPDEDIFCGVVDTDWKKIAELEKKTK